MGHNKAPGQAAPGLLVLRVKTAGPRPSFTHDQPRAVSGLARVTWQPGVWEQTQAFQVPAMSQDLQECL